MQSDTEFAKVDNVMLSWRQGDVVLGDYLPFVHLADLTQPLTAEARQLAAEDPDAAEPLANVATTMVGFVVVTQTCDIVRPSKSRPFVEIAPLKEVSSEDVQRAPQIPSIAKIPEVAERNLVADLDRVMTLEKSVLAALPEDARTKRCASDKEQSDFASALARKRQRFAFPDDFNQAISKLRNRIVKKHGKQTFDKNNKPTEEGAIYAQMREIRVLCPDWGANPLDINFLFIFETKVEIPPEAHRIIGEELIDRISEDSRCAEPEMRVVGLDELPTADWLASVQLDYDHLSGYDED